MVNINGTTITITRGDTLEANRNTQTGSRSS